MHWINFPIKAHCSQCSIIHLAVCTMRKDFHVIFVNFGLILLRHYLKN